MGSIAQCRSRSRAAGILLLLPLLLGGCAVQVGAPASESSWRSDTDKALGAALSGLGAARLVLENRDDGKLPDRYVAVALRDALRVFQTETSGYLAAQPPASRLSENATAVAVLQDTVTVLNQAAVAGSGDSRRERSAAMRSVVAEYHQVEKLQHELVG